jgi:hypothetical protein
MKQSLLTFLFLSFSIISLSQEIQKIKAEGIAYFKTDLSEKQMFQEALENARIAALEKAFGTAVSNENSLLIKNNQVGTKVTVEQRFISYGKTKVYGEILSNNSEPIYTWKIVDGIKTLYCNIDVQVRQLDENRPNFSCKILDCDNNASNCESDVFKNMSHMYVSFNAGNSGYLYLFLEDEQGFYCLLPYKNLPDSMRNGYPIERTKTNIFFSPSKGAFGNQNNRLVDEIVLATTQQLEINKLIVVYSLKPMQFPVSKILEQQPTVKEESETPTFIEKTVFLDWLYRLRIKRPEIAVEEKYVLIKQDNDR